MLAELEIMKSKPESNPPEFAPRLDMIETQWSILRRAHKGTMEGGGDAKNALVMRYSSAVRSYIRKIVDNDSDANDLAQEIVVRMLKGDFAGADSNRGKFRNLLKVAVKNMIRNHWAKAKVRKNVDYDLNLEEGKGSEVDFDESWTKSLRDNILEIAWSGLNEYQEQNQGSVAHTVLRLRVNSPKSSSTELAEALSRAIGREVNAATYRQQLRRARVRFAEYIAEEIADGLHEPSPELVREELISLGLFEFIKDVLPENWGAKPN